MLLQSKPTCASCGSKHVINVDAEDKSPPVCADCSYSTPSLNRNIRANSKVHNPSVENIFLQINGSQSQINLNSLSNHRNSLRGTKHQSLPRDVPGLVGEDEPVAGPSGTPPGDKVTEVTYDVKLPFRRGSSSFSHSSSDTSSSSPPERPTLRERPLGHSAETDKSSSSDRLPRRPGNLARGGSMDSEHFNQKRLQDTPLGGSMDKAPGSCGPRRKFRDMPLGGSLDNNAGSLESPVAPPPAVVPPPRTTSLLASLIERGSTPGVLVKNHGASRCEAANNAAARGQHTSLPIDSSFLKRSLGDSLPGIYETRLMRTPSPRTQSSQNINKRQDGNSLADSVISRDLCRQFKSMDISSHLEEENEDTYDVLFADMRKCVRPNYLNLNHVVKPKLNPMNNNIKHPFNQKVNPGSKHTVL